MNLRMTIAGVTGFLAVALAAFGAHGLPASLPAAQRHAFDTAAQFHLAHALFLAALSLAPGGRWLRWSYALTLFGVVMFCGALYGFALSGATAVTFVAPIGGLSLMAGWLMFAAAGVAQKPSNQKN